MSDAHLTDTRFSDFDLPAELLQGIESAGFSRCTPSQAETLPLALAGQGQRQGFGLARSATGKTRGLNALQQFGGKIEIAETGIGQVGVAHGGLEYQIPQAMDLQSHPGWAQMCASGPGWPVQRGRHNLER